MPVTKVGTRAFATQRQAQAYVRRVLRMIGVCDPVTNKAHVQLLEDLLAQSPYRDVVVGSGYATFAVDWNSRKTGLQVYVNRVDGTRGYLSVLNNCLTGKELSADKKLKLMMRWAVNHQVKAYKKLHEDQRVCALCHSSIAPTEAVVDHVVPFCSLADTFVKQTHLAVPDEFVRNPETNYWEFREEDRPFEKAWSKYHEERAVLRVVCETCNRSKGGKHVPVEKAIREGTDTA